MAYHEITNELNNDEARLWYSICRQHLPNEHEHLRNCVLTRCKLVSAMFVIQQLPAVVKVGFRSLGLACFGMIRFLRFGFSEGRHSHQRCLSDKSQTLPEA